MPKTKNLRSVLHRSRTTENTISIAMNDNLLSFLPRLLPGVAAIGIQEPVPTATADIIDQQTVASVSSDAISGIDQTERALTERVPQIRLTETRALEMLRYTENLSTVSDLLEIALLLGNDSEWLTAVRDQNLPGPTFPNTKLKNQ